MKTTAGMNITMLVVGSDDESDAGSQSPVPRGQIAPAISSDIQPCYESPVPDGQTNMLEYQFPVPDGQMNYLEPNNAAYSYRCLWTQQGRTPMRTTSRPR